MLATLLKYDFKALNRVMLPLQGCVLVAGVLGCIFMRLTFMGLMNSLPYGSTSGISAFEEMISATAIGLSFLFFAAVFASSWLTLFLIARHFYKTCLRDEAYLTFTLPVTINKNLISKVIAGSVWFLVNIVILLAVSILALLVGFSESGLINTGVLNDLRSLLLELSNPEGFAFMFEVLVLFIVIAVTGILQVYFSLIVGGAIARNYKVLVAIGIYVACSMVLQTFLSFVMGIGLAILLDNYWYYSGWILAAQPLLIGSLVLYLACGVVFFLVGKHLLKNKLNLD